MFHERDEDPAQARYDAWMDEHGDRMFEPGELVAALSAGEKDDLIEGIVEVLNRPIDPAHGDEAHAQESGKMLLALLARTIVKKTLEAFRKENS